MSSVNSDQNFNDKEANTQEEKTDGLGAEKECDTNSVGDHCDQQNVAVGVKQDPQEATLKDMDQNLNAVEAQEACDTGKNANSAPDTCSHATMSQRLADLVLRDRLVHKVNELDVTGRVNQAVQNNKSAVILKKETDSLKNLLVYDNSSDEDDDFEKNWQLHTIPDSCSDSESDSDDSIVYSSDDDTDDVSHQIITPNRTGAIRKEPIKNGAPIQFGDEDLGKLPPLPDLSKLSINYEKEEFLHMGHIQAIIDKLVTVEALPGTPAYDLDSCLFIEDQTSKRPLGAVYDVIGPVTAPIYCIRFNSVKDIEELNIKQGAKVFSAPKSQYTHYVFVKELMKNKGTDASWVGDSELPAEVAAEMSDDEDEDNLQNARKAQKRKHGSLERHKQFEESMNRCNTINTRVAQIVDAHRRIPRPQHFNSDPHQPQQRSFVSDFCSGRPPVAPFDPTVPPPGFQDYVRRQYSSSDRPPVQWGWGPQRRYRPPVGPPNAAPFVQGQNNSANYYTNNAGRSHAAGPSTQPH